MTVIWKPEVFQGSGKTKNYFEGWYYKSVSKDEKNAYAIISGISLTGNSKSHAFVMVLDARKQKLYSQEYPLKEFFADKKFFKIKIGNNCFTKDHVHIEMKQESDVINADLHFQDITPWPVTTLSPGVMGWYRFIPFMECYHGVLSFNHTISGLIEINDETIDLTNGRGYMEKDWGSSMPSSWIWMQTNHFNEDYVSLFGSIAKIPWLHNYFTGYIFGLFFKGKLYKFTTYNGSKITDLMVSREKIRIKLENRNYQLNIEALRTEGVDLPAPKMGEMISKVNESLKSEINLELLDKKLNKIIFSGKGKNSGLEFVGDTDELINGLRS